MKYYIIAGEKSGDLHASNLMKAIKEEDKEAKFRFWGGDEMQQVGGEIVRHYKDLAFMGVWEVIKNLRKIAGFLKECKRDILEYQPDLIILVDYSGFNMKIAKFAKKHKILNFYYISPKVWAWNTKRAYKIKKYVDKLFVILPFEVEFFKKYDYEVEYVGNPLVDAIESFEPEENFSKEYDLDKKPIIALLPGSRKQEVENMLEIMLSVREQFFTYQFVIAGVSNLDKSFYEPYEKLANVSVVYEKTYQILHLAEVALVTSGTATLETGLFKVPQVVCYKTSAFTYAIAKRVVKIPYISLVNLVAEKEIVKELIQKELTKENLIQELKKIILGGEERKVQEEEYKLLKRKIGKAGASQKAGKLMLKYYKEIFAQKS